MGFCCSKEANTLSGTHQALGAFRVEADYTSLPNRVQLRGGRLPSVGCSGLNNLGNMCFMNSFVQCVVATQPLLDYFLGDTYKEHLNLKSGSEFTEATAAIMIKQWL